jgi:carboxylate-amine ligase
VADRPTSEWPQIGVEEEFLLIDAETRAPTPRIGDVLPGAVALAGDRAQEELHQAQIEHATAPCRSLADLRRELLDLRGMFVRAAASHGALVVASGTYPGQMGTDGQLITRGDRYGELADANAMVAREQLICGCHIHVSVSSPDRAIGIMNHIRAWLPYLLALSANSPFWEGDDTGFASYRTEVWARWPTSGSPHPFESLEEYRAVVQQLVSAGIIIDAKMAYWDVRPSESFPTLEIRVNDVMAEVDDVVAVAGLARALVVMCEREGVAAPRYRWELLRGASWLAARSGLSGSLLSPLDGTTKPAGLAVEDLLRYVTPALDESGELEEIRALTMALVHRGNGAARQRAAWARRGRIDDVIESVTLGVNGRHRSLP